jgi:two-component system, NarL family, sensor kinase
VQISKTYIIAFLVVTSLLILILAGLVIMVIHLYQRRQLLNGQSLTNLTQEHEQSLVKAQLEMQEHTFQNISREIHDNIHLSLTLAKLHLNTLRIPDDVTKVNKINSAVDLLSQSISTLSDISKSLNSDIIISQGLIKALENEIERIRETGLFKIDLKIGGEPLYLDTEKELLLFRIVQEGFNNIIKHSKATETQITLQYGKSDLQLNLIDNGMGFIQISNGMSPDRKAGIKNMASRIKILGGFMNIDSFPGKGTTLSFSIPY